MIEAPQDRSAELRKAVEFFHGRMHQFFFSFGEYDGLSVVEFLEQRGLCVVRSVSYWRRR